MVKCTEADKKALESVTINPADMEDDGTNYLGVRIKKPWGHEVERYRDEKSSVWWLHIYTGHKTSMHCHLTKTTLLFVVAGIGTLKTLNGSHVISGGEMVVIEKGAFHQTVNEGDHLILWETETPPLKRDLVRLTDDYGRQGQGYERIST